MRTALVCEVEPQCKFRANRVEFGLGCEYMREKKKRGKASKKDLAERAAQESTTVGGQTDGGSDGKESIDSPTGSQRLEKDAVDRQGSVSSGHGSISRRDTGDAQFQSVGHQAQTPSHFGEFSDQEQIPHPLSFHTSDLRGAHRPMNMHNYSGMATNYDRHSLGSDELMTGGNAFEPPQQHNMQGYPDMSFGMMGNSPTQFDGSTGFRMGDSPINGYAMGGTAASPGWVVGLPPTQGQFQTHMHHAGFNQSSLRYPVLEPLLPHLAGVMPPSLACDLIDLYFSASSSTLTHPTSPYILGIVFRRRAFLHPTRPRKCQPALLASMLLVAAQTSEAPLLTSAPSARAKMCQRLLDLTVALLRPLIHSSPVDAASTVNHRVGAVPLSGLGVAHADSMSTDAMSGESGGFAASGHLDDLVTYVHLATVVSASEYKGASLRWWNVAWSLARELKLGRELPISEQYARSDQPELESEGMDAHDLDRNTPGVVTEEEREERRRIFWLVYTVDRHLALCYNRPLFFLDVECEGLRQPIDDGKWQRGEFNSRRHNATLDATSVDDSDVPPAGPQFECRGLSIFGYFLPLMTILGEVVDLHHARNHPRFGGAFRASQEWGNQVSQVRQHLEAYEASLGRIRATHLTDDAMFASDAISSPTHSVHTSASSSRMTEAEVQTRVVLAYGTHVMHVLQILLNGKWDPIQLLDDRDFWVSSPEFVDASNHAVAAAEAVSQILEYDPGLECMPFFFGVYLLQGSFLLLLIADKLQFEATPSVVKACETIVRAHEASVVTLSTEYQVGRPLNDTVNVGLIMAVAQVQQSHARSAIARARARAR